MARRYSAPPRLTRRTPAAASSDELHRAGARADQHVDRLRRHRLHHRADRRHVGQQRGIEHVGPGLGEGDEAADRVVEIGAAVQEIVGAPGQQDAPARRLGGAADARDGVVEFVDRVRRIGRGVLDAEARQPGRDGGLHGARAVLGVGAEPVLQVAVHRQPGHAAEQARIRHRVGEADRVLPVLPPHREGDGERGTAERLKPRALQQHRRGAVPGVGHDEGTRPLVQGAELLVSRWIVHGPPPHQRWTEV